MDCCRSMKKLAPESPLIDLSSIVGNFVFFPSHFFLITSCELFVAWFILPCFVLLVAYVIAAT